MKLARRIARFLHEHLPVVHADMAAMYAVGVDLMPISGHLPDVRMVREEVDISVCAQLVAVVAVFDFHNDGEDDEIVVGFPSLGPPVRCRPSDAGIQDFAATVDGAAVECTEHVSSNADYPLWKVWKQRFPGGAITRITARYWVPLAGYRLVSRMPFVYVLRTGRYWNGTIGEAIVRVRAVDIPFAALREATPAGFTTDAGEKTLTWHFRDLVPEVDIGLLVSPLTVAGGQGGMQVEDVTELVESPPPVGTKVQVAGLLLDDPFERLPCTTRLYSERWYDRNTNIPDGIRVFDRHDPADGPALSVELRVPGDPLRQQYGLTMAPWQDWSGQHYLVEGCIGRDDRGLFIAVEKLVRIVWRSRPPHVPGQFSWISGQYDMESNSRASPTRWPSMSRYAEDYGAPDDLTGERCRVHGPREQQ